MACTLSNSGIATGLVIRASHVSQSVDAFTKGNAYDITLSGSLVITGSVAFSSSEAFDFNIKGLSCIPQSHLLNYNCTNGTVSFIEASSATQQPSVSPYYTASVAGKEILPLGGNNIMGCSSYSVIGGGCLNKICSSTLPGAASQINYIGGGQCNVINGSWGSNVNTIGGGNGNIIQGYAIYYNYIGGGNRNCITSSMELADLKNSTSNVIAGGSSNKICGSSCNSSILGGVSNTIQTCVVVGTSNVINGGGWNNISSNDGNISISQNLIGSGCRNTINGDYHSSTSPGISTNICSNFIGGGFLNTGSCSRGFIAAGCCNHLIHDDAFILGADITSVATHTVHVNNLNVGCTTQMQLRNPIGTGAAGMLVACDAGGGTAELYFHDGSTYKKVCLVP
tara:strand:- start:2623 stop:3810 length:1188 start_codon:yes stop_codon:yes gene_type:complete